MSEAVWGAVEEFFAGKLERPDPVLEGVIALSKEAGLPDIRVSTSQGLMLGMLVGAMGAHRVLELGTLGGFSAVCMARALPAGGLLVTVEKDPHHASTAERAFALAGVREKIDLRIGAALDVLPGISQRYGRTFDLAFIDADKPNNPAYFAHAKRPVKAGGIIIVDNVVRDGAVADDASTDPSVLGVRALASDVGGDRDVACAAVMQTVGVKGYDGFLMARLSA